MKEKFKSLDWIKKKSQQTGDSEPEQAGIRLVIGVLLALYFFVPWAEGETFVQSITSVASIMLMSYYAGALAIVLAIHLHPKPSPIRRVSGILLDLVTLSAVMHIAGSQSVFLFVVYLWVILGNGFRYGLLYLYISLVIGVVGFSIAITWGEYWQSHAGSISISLLFLLVLIPAYTSFLLKKLHAAMAYAKQANEAKTKFLANMSHELRTPLNGVIGMGDLLRETKLDSEQRELVSTMHSSARTLLGLIEKVLDISKIEAGKIEITSNQLDLHALVNSVLAMQVPIGMTKGLSVSCTIDSDVPFLLQGDKQHIRQVLINLIGNAIKFTDHGSVNLHVYQLMTNDDEAYIRFDVKDTGIGIAEHSLDNVFDDFTQVGVSTKHTSGGTGLGTTISKELVELMGGKMGVESQLHQGSTFWFELPFVTVSHDNLDISGNHLLVMSTEDTTDVLSPMLASWNVEFDLVKSPVHSLTMLNRAIEKSDGYKILLVDRLSLGDLSPVEYAEILKAERLLDELSLVLINSSDDNLNTDEVGQFYISVINELTDKRILFNAIHAAQSIHVNAENVVSISEHYSSQNGANPLNILVAEDNKVNQQVIDGILKRAGHTVRITDNGEKALDILVTDLDQIDLLIVDKNMPELSGDEVVQALRYMDTQKHLPVIMLTADATPEAKQASFAIGVDEFLTKPIDSFSLLEKIAILSKQAKPDKDKRNKQIPIAPSLEQEDDISSNDSEIVWYDQAVFEQLVMLDNDPEFIKRLIKGFVLDGEKHIAGIKDSVANDYLQLRESLHALKGSATELGAKRLADVCIQGEAYKPYDIGSEKVIQLSHDIERIYNNTIAALDVAVAEATRLT
ncbi:MAG: hybrid sensor histidine kinase/response regulator [Gammaproteobacteria bacterium]|nr:MAG: hybrid sensor histidine kinase/response regulator [Gammaproteobacteria bacterium]RKZ96447.1 MAG: hybrid sensor histidine kinase/response regulator [Gammaproteobacteria bacterium]RLA02011.1 MAG: hybrid sensor histidine kinase/response regulator [Gammaproteobacteria bacterium]